jgi:mono/diheme cytochrome c family protein
LACVTRRLVFCLLLLASAPAAAQSNGTPERSVAGAFTEDQVARGEVAFRSFCQSCHEPTFHTGDQFRMSWFGRTVFDYFKVVKTTMPEDNPGGLSDDDYVRVLTYIFKLNGFPAGADSIPTDTVAMKRIRIVSPTDTVKPGRR